jgi:hypothetical protein
VKLLIIEKEREYSLKILVLQALVRRLRPDHYMLPVIKQDLSTALAGHKGEESIDYYLEVMPDIDSEFYVFHDLRLPYKNHYFQIDTLLVFPTFYIILEVKNFAGLLTFDPAYQQLIQTKFENGIEKKTIHPDPIQQVNMQLSQLKSWLKLMKLPTMPGESLVVMANTRSEIRAISHENIVRNYVIRNAAISDRLKGFLTIHPKQVWSKRDLKRFRSNLLKGNEPSTTIDIFKKYNLIYSDLLKGVQCTRCLAFSMKRNSSRWICLSCLHSSKDGLLPALKDYKLLINPTITNRDFRDFFGIENERTARRILVSTEYEYHGTTKNRHYIL